MATRRPTIKRFILLVVTGIGIALSIICFNNYLTIRTLSVNKTMRAALIDYSSESVEIVHINISGTLRKRASKLIRFDGTIEIPEVDFKTFDKSWIDFSTSRGGLIMRNQDATDVYAYGRVFLYSDDFWPMRIEWNCDPHQGSNTLVNANRWILTAPIYGFEQQS